MPVSPTAEGRMAEQIASFDWAKTPLGPMKTWSQSLRTAVDIMLGSGHAMQLAWGPERTVLYNDEYAPMLGERHPSALGLPFRLAWPDVWNEIAPLVDRVFAGETVRFQNMPLVMTRHGFAEETWWNFSYSPVRDEQGAIAGLLNVTVDASAPMRAERAERERDKANQQMRRDRSHMQALLSASSDAIYTMNPDWSELHQLDGRGFIADTDAPSLRWMEDYLLPEDRHLVEAEIARAVASNTSFALEHRVRRADGSVGWTFSRAVPVHDGVGQVAQWFGMATDITERREEERRQAFLLRLGDDLLPLADVAQIRATLCRHLGEELEADRVYYLNYSQEDGFGVVADDYRRGPLASLAGRYPFDAFRSTYERISNGQTWIVNDVSAETGIAPAERDYYAAQGVVAWVDVPLVKRAQLRAVLCVVQGVARQWSAAEIRLAEDAATRLWDAIERARAEQALGESEGQLQVLVGELQHRTRNLIGVIRSLSERTAASSTGLGDYQDRFRARLGALGRAQGLLSQLQAHDRVTFDTLLRTELQALGGDTEHVTLSGPEGVRLRSSTVQLLSLALHELATNAAKYGALSTPEGRLDISWSVHEAQRLHLVWRETGMVLRGDPGPAKKGGGRELIEKALPYQLQATARFDLRPSGLVCTIEFPIWQEHTHGDA